MAQEKTEHRTDRVVPEDAFLARLDEADRALADGDRDGAIEELVAAESILPIDGDVPLLLAAIYHEDGDADATHTWAMRSISRTPYNPRAWLLVAAAALLRGQGAVARVACKRVLKLAPGHAAARRLLRDARKLESGADKGGVDDKGNEVLDAARESLDGITAVVLVRDDVPDPTATLQAVGPLVREVVVVDARTDPDPPLALDDLSLPATILVSDRPDPAGAFAQGARHAGEGWLWFLFADETPADDAASFLDLVRSRCTDLYHPTTIVPPDGTDRGPRSAVRLVRNLPGLRLVGPEASPVAALRDACADWGLGTGVPGLGIASAGSAFAATDEGPEDAAAARLRSAWVEFEAGRYDAAASVARAVLVERQALPNAAGEADLEEPVTLAGACLLRGERWNELVEQAGEYNRHHRASASTLFLEGVATLAIGNTERALELLDRALRRSDVAGHAPPLAETWSAGLPNVLGAVCLERREFDRAAEAFDRALERDPDNVEAHLGILTVRTARGEADAVLAGLDRLVELDGEHPRIWTAGAVVLSQLPGLAAAQVAWLDEAVRRFPDDVELRRRLGAAHLTAGQAERAVETWDDVPASGTPAELGGRVAASLLGAGSPPEIPQAQGEAVADAVLGWYRAWVHQNAYEALDTALVHLDRAIDRVPSLGPRTAAWLDEIGQREAAERVRTKWS